MGRGRLLTLAGLGLGLLLLRPAPPGAEAPQAAPASGDSPRPRVTRSMAEEAPEPAPPPPEVHPAAAPDLPSGPGTWLGSLTVEEAAAAPERLRAQNLARARALARGALEAQLQGADAAWLGETLDRSEAALDAARAEAP